MAEAVDATLVVEVRWHGADLDRLVDRDHAAMQAGAAERLGRAGWLAQPEVSFNHYGDRGRCDLLAWHPATRTMLVVEVKTRIGNVQETLGRLDVKTRLGWHLAEQVGWGRPALVIPAFVLRADRSTRRVLQRHEAIFRRYGMRGRSAGAWLRAPVATSGLILFEGTDSHDSSVIGRRRVRMTPPAG